MNRRPQDARGAALLHLPFLLLLISIFISALIRGGMVWIQTAMGRIAVVAGVWVIANALVRRFVWKRPHPVLPGIFGGTGCVLLGAQSLGITPAFFADYMVIAVTGCSVLAAWLYGRWDRTLVRDD